MKVEVNTGGLKKFVYAEDYNPKNSPEEDEAIDRAIAKHKRRKKYKIFYNYLYAILAIAILIGLYKFLT